MTKRMTMALLALVGVFIGTYLTLFHYGVIGTLACGVGSCETVQASKWSMLLGLPVAAWGLGFYALMVLLTFASIQPRWAESRRLSLAILLLTAWGVLFSSWLTYLEAQVIHAWCQWCVISACVVAAMFVLALLDWRDGSVNEPPFTA
jgi:uncharacterized membrane protein